MTEVICATTVWAGDAARRHRWLALTWLVFAVAVLLFGCSRPEPPTLLPRSAEVVGVSAAGLTLRLKVDVTNPNGFALSVDEVTGRVVLDGRVALGEASVSSGVSVPARSTAPVEAQMVVPWVNLGEVTRLASEGRGVRYRFEGRAGVSAAKLRADVPFVLEGDVTAAQLVQAGLTSLRGLPLFGK